jgi:hypothetical protein
MIPAHGVIYENKPFVVYQAGERFEVHHGTLLCSTHSDASAAAAEVDRRKLLLTHATRHLS